MKWLQPVRNIRIRLWRLLTSPGEELGRGARFLQVQMRVVYFCLRRMRENNAMATSAALSFRTIFAMIPTIVLAVVAMKSFVSVEQSRAWFQQAMEKGGLTLIRVADGQAPTTLPASAPADAGAPSATAPASAPGDEAGDAETAEVITAADKIQEMVDLVQGKLTFGRLGPIGVALLIWSALTLMTTMERALNRIFAAPKARGLGRRVLLYWSGLTFMPVAFVVADYAGARAASFFAHVGGLGWILVVLGWIQPLIVGVLLLAALYVLMPNTKVSLKAGLIGASVAFPIWLVARWAFALYVTRVVGNNPLYGSLGLLPLFLMWLNISWLLLLFGAELAHTAANVGKLSFADQSERTFLGPWEVLAAALAVAGRYASGDGAASVSDVSRRLNLPPASAQTLLDRLHERGTVCRVENAEEPAYVPARSAETILVAEVLAFTKGDDPGRSGLRFQPDLARIVQGVRATAHQALADETLADLLRTGGK